MLRQVIHSEAHQAMEHQQKLHRIITMLQFNPGAMDFLETLLHLNIQPLVLTRDPERVLRDPQMERVCLIEKLQVVTHLLIVVLI